MKSSFLSLFAGLVAVALAVSTGNAADEPVKKDSVKKQRKPVTTVKCPIAGKEIKIADATAVEYKKAKVYVCCGNCKKKMEKDSTPYAAKANQQLVKTRQYRQAKCPLSGGHMNKEQKSKVAGTMVRYCCEKCKGKVDEAEKDAQLAMIFSDKAFDKAYVPVKKKKQAE